MSEAHEWLLKALIQPLPQAGDAWRSWRSSVDLDRLDPASFWMLPSLAARMQEWIVNDPQQDILVGICKRAWSKNQLVSQLGTQATEVLRSAGLRPAWSGPAAWAQRYWPEGAIRPIEWVDLLLDYEAVGPAMDALSRSGWTVAGRRPNSRAAKFYFSPPIPVRYQSTGMVRLHWRDLPNTDFALRRPPLSQSPNLSAEYDFLRILGGEFDDALDWRCDALMIGGARPLDWDSIVGLLKWRSRAKARLAELCREWNVEVPPHARKQVRTTVANRMVTGSLGTYRRLKFKLAVRRGL
jgi:hypothetical protein